ncbi:molybdopterin-dependent oxidoreductase [Sinorhizobium sp. 22678]|uniref:molybdopterin-dependent oxidoreductase n=1 Tax=Sinorhizobium sp. 22678 TaxID=3453955 RepID=UPI003F86A6C5
MKRYTTSHWGTYEIHQPNDGLPELVPHTEDPDPSQIGLHQIAAGQAACRVLRPAVRESWLREGPGVAPPTRGDEPFIEVSWDTALDLVARDLGRVRGRFGNSAIFGGSYGWSSAGRFHHAQSQIHRFLNSIGGYVRHRDSYSIAAAQVIMGHIVAPMSELEFNHTSWPVMQAHTELFVAFGGIPVKNTQVSAGGPVRHRVVDGLKGLARAGCRFINISPVRDNLVIEEADIEWIPIRPNTDVALMLAVAYVLESEGLADTAFLNSHTVGYEIVRSYLLGHADGTAKTPDWASNICGVPAARIHQLAHEIHIQRTMMNAAWSLQRARFGEQPFWGLVLIAAMLGQIGLPGGGFGVGYGMTNSIGSPDRKMRGPTLSQGYNAVTDFIPVARVADMLLNPGASFTYNGETRNYPDIRLVYWAGGNPFHHHQDLNRLRKAWQKPETIVVHEQFWTATAKHADIVLPATTSLERDDLAFANREGHLVAMRRVLAAPGSARDDYAIFTALAERLHAAPAFTEGRSVEEWLRVLYEGTRADWSETGVTIPPFDVFWQDGLIALPSPETQTSMLDAFRHDPVAHPLNTPSGRIELFSKTIAGFGLEDCPGHVYWQEPPEWLGGVVAKDHPLHLLSDQPTRRLHSQYDHSSWSRDGKIAQREPVYIHPDDAVARGISQGDVVMLYNSRGKCLAGACVSDAVMPGVLRLATGAWYDRRPGDDLEKHGNPNVLTLDIGCSGLSQGCSAQTCLVQLSGPIEDPPPVTAFDPPRFVSA